MVRGYDYGEIGRIRGPFVEAFLGRAAKPDCMGTDVLDCPKGLPAGREACRHEHYLRN